MHKLALSSKSHDLSLDLHYIRDLYCYKSKEAMASWKILPACLAQFELYTDFKRSNLKRSLLLLWLIGYISIVLIDEWIIGVMKINRHGIQNHLNGSFTLTIAIVTCVSKQEDYVNPLRVTIVRWSSYS